MVRPRGTATWMVMMCGGAVTVVGRDEIAPLSSGARRNGEGLLMVLQWQIVGKGEAAIVHRREEVDWKCAIVEEGLRVVVAHEGCACSGYPFFD
ncbi:hypothetical protein SESBI_26891 [Sesbania bispinosa]|nr:hypothetical protein SESBI_26891 [Sesbania bispinosa]